MDERRTLLYDQYSSIQTAEADEIKADNADTQKRQGCSCNLGLAITACVLGSSFQYGYSLSVVDSPERVIKMFLNETEHDRTGVYMTKSKSTLIWAVIVSIFAVGGMFGGMSAGTLANRFGRKNVLLLNNILVLVGALLEGFSKMAESYEMLLVGRFIIGVNAGINTGVAPLYISEIAPVRLRGLASTFNQLAIAFGIMMGDIIGLRLILGGPEYWPLAVALPLVPMVFQLCTLPICQESPRHLLLSVGDVNKAEKALRWFRQTDDVYREIEEMRKEQRGQPTDVKNFSVFTLLRTAELRRPLIICVVMQLSRQFSAVSAVVYYSTQIFTGSGLSENAAQYATVIMGAVNVVMTFISAMLMERVGRRRLHLTGVAGMFLFLVVLTIGMVFKKEVSWFSYVSVAAVILYIISYATGPAAIPWFYVAELFTQGPRSTASSICVFINWTVNFIVGLIFPILSDLIHVYSFIPFAILLVIFWIYLYIRAPETKGKTIEEITALFKTRSPPENAQSYNSLGNGYLIS